MATDAQVQTVSEFDEIRPYEEGEMKQAFEELLADRQFNHLLQGFLPWIPKGIRNAILKLAFSGIRTPLDFQLRFMKPVVRYILHRASTGHSSNFDAIHKGDERYTFVSNHRDIVLDSAILDMMLVNEGFPTTCEIAIGDNLLIYPWIKRLVRMNKAFTVRRGLTPRELFASSQLMSRYIHHAVNDKHENIWIAQREGRAKDSNDRTQDSVLKMLAMGGDGSIIERLKNIHIVPLTISYEYDPCDYLKAAEFQMKRDNPNYKKSRQNDLDNMKTGILGQKGHIHYQVSPCIDSWLDELKDTPKAEVFNVVAQRMDKEIHKNYFIYPNNYVAADLLHGTKEFSNHYTAKDKQGFEAYLQQRIQLIDLPQKDEPFLREKLLQMYANPLINHLVALHE